MNQTSVVQLFKDTFSEWSEDKVPRLAAALAYYSAFALAPLLLVGTDSPAVAQALIDTAANTPREDIHGN